VPALAASMASAGESLARDSQNKINQERGRSLLKDSIEMFDRIGCETKERLTSILAYLRNCPEEEAETLAKSSLAMMKRVLASAPHYHTPIYESFCNTTKNNQHIILELRRKLYPVALFSQIEDDRLGIGHTGNTNNV